MTLPLVLLRHGESEWNKANLFTGWYDCDLSPRGEEEARAGGKLMAAEGLAFDVVHTSLLIRPTPTAHLALAAMGHARLPVRRPWRPNPPHSGRLQGPHQQQTRDQYCHPQL